MNVIYGMTIKANREQVLETLRKNRDAHVKMVAEAREGFLLEAKSWLRARLKEVKAGKAPDLESDLEPPPNHTNVYDTAIRMLELSVDGTISLTSEQVRNLVMDEWDWKEVFIQTTTNYSNSVQKLRKKS